MSTTLVPSTGNSFAPFWLGIFGSFQLVPGGMIEAQIGIGGWLGGLGRGLVAEHFEQNTILHAGRLMHRNTNQEHLTSHIEDREGGCSFP